MKGVSAEGRKKTDAETILNQVQHKVHDNRVWFSFFVIPNLFRDLGLKNLGFKAPPLCGALYYDRFVKPWKYTWLFVI
jgi:hypothetical protein